MYDQKEQKVSGMIGMLDLHGGHYFGILIAGFIQKFIARLQDMIGSAPSLVFPHYMYIRMHMVHAAVVPFCSPCEPDHMLKF